jgi:hypothetical protein
MCNDHRYTRTRCQAKRVRPQLREAGGRLGLRCTTADKLCVHAIDAIVKALQPEDYLCYTTAHAGF